MERLQMNILVSACFLGMGCRYDGTGYLLEELNLLKEKHTLIPICPEIYGGLQTPRDPAEILNDRVITKKGQDVTSEFHKGANEIIKLARFYQCTHAILKERSPSCGHGKIYDGTFTGTLINGNGVAADLLSKEGIHILGESEINSLLK